MRINDIPRCKAESLENLAVEKIIIFQMYLDLFLPILEHIRGVTKNLNFKTFAKYNYAAKFYKNRAFRRGTTPAYTT